MEYQNKNDNGAFMPSTLDDYLLDPYEFRIYMRITRRAGVNGCYESVNNMAKACRVSLAKARKSLHSLHELGLITIIDRSKQGLTNLCTVNPFSSWKPKRDIETIELEKKENYAKANGGLTRSEVARANKKKNQPLPNTLVPPLSNMVDPPIEYGSTPLANMVDKGTPVKLSTQGTPENIECFATNHKPKEPDVIQSTAVANESRQPQDMNEVQEIEYISFAENLDPNITPPSVAPPSVAPPTIPCEKENNEAIAGELVVSIPVVNRILDPYDLTDLGIEGMPESVKKGLDEAMKARDKKKYTYEIQSASKYLIGNLPKHYRKSKVILSPSPNDIDPRFKQFLFDQMKDAKEIGEATNWIKAMELDPTRWEELSDSVHGFLVFLDTGKNMKQVKKEFDRQQSRSANNGNTELESLVNSCLT